MTITPWSHERIETLLSYGEAKCSLFPINFLLFYWIKFILKDNIVDFNLSWIPSPPPSHCLQLSNFFTPFFFCWHNKLMAPLYIRSWLLEDYGNLLAKIVIGKKLLWIVQLCIILKFNGCWYSLYFILIVECIESTINLFKSLHRLEIMLLMHFKHDIMYLNILIMLHLSIVLLCA